MRDDGLETLFIDGIGDILARKQMATHQESMSSPLCIVHSDAATGSGPADGNRKQFNAVTRSTRMNCSNQG